MLQPCVAGLIFCGLTASALADPLAIASLPQETRWVLHINADAARGSPLWESLHSKFIAPHKADIMPHIEAMQNITGVNVATGLHDVTLYGTSFDEANTCIYIHANFDQERTIAFLKLDPEFTTTPHNDHAIFSWRDKERDRLVYASFASNNVAILAPNPKMVMLALDTIDTKTPSLKPASPLAPPSMLNAPTTATGGGGGVGAPSLALPLKGGNVPTPMFWLACINVSDLPRTQKVESPFLLQVDTASIAVTSAEDKVTGRLMVTAQSDKAAMQMATAGEGIKATMSLLSADDHAPPRVKLLSGLLQNLSITTENKSLNSEWSITIYQFEALIDTMRPIAPPPPPSPLPAPGTSPLTPKAIP